MGSHALSLACGGAEKALSDAWAGEPSRAMKLRSVLLLAALLVGTALPPGFAQSQIKIGAAESLTGNAAQYGVSIRRGLELAAAEINAAGGVNGRRIDLLVENEQGKKEEAINVFKKLIFQDKVLMLFGPTLSNSAQASDPAG